ncbi:MAG: two-component system response regulator [Elusimicrobia bacterium CG08_land_8_20_14_0_20_51_18]|nr:MAG: two-component system response regulator [Elusimicrobia bacterium CG08_land_8_20_14_0_20_51_18]
MPKKILLVEDEDLIVKVLSIRLENAGYKVESAFDGNEGLEKARKNPPDLAIIDIGLPKIDGNTLCELIKSNENTKKTRIIMLTGRRLVGDMETSFKSGADIYVNKPYEWDRLLEKVQKLIGK